ncbi:MAG: DUF1566 domain-containing protein [Nitrospinaceae bacterium]
MANWEKLFKDNGDGTITQVDEDLIWSKKDSRQELGKWLNWDEANAYQDACNEQKYLGTTHWRLPTKSEMRGLLNGKEVYEKLFMNPPVKNKRSVANYQAGGEWSYWTSETRYDSYAWKCYYPVIKEVCVDQQVSTTGTSVRLVRDA